MSNDLLSYEDIAEALLHVVPEQKLTELEQLLIQHDTEGLELFFSHPQYSPSITAQYVRRARH
jgi:hypothetical protein